MKKLGQGDMEWLISRLNRLIDVSVKDEETGGGYVVSGWLKAAYPSGISVFRMDDKELVDIVAMDIIGFSDVE